MLAGGFEQVGDGLSEDGRGGVDEEVEAGGGGGEVGAGLGLVGFEGGFLLEDLGEVGLGGGDGVAGGDELGAAAAAGFGEVLEVLDAFAADGDGLLELSLVGAVRLAEGAEAGEAGAEALDGREGLGEPFLVLTPGGRVDAVERIACAHAVELVGEQLDATGQRGAVLTPRGWQVLEPTRHAEGLVDPAALDLHEGDAEVGPDGWGNRDDVGVRRGFFLGMGVAGWRRGVAIGLAAPGGEYREGDRGGEGERACRDRHRAGSSVGAPVIGAASDAGAGLGAGAV